MVNRVFCYSKETAIKNGNKLPIIHIVLPSILFFVLTLFMSIALPELNMWLFMILILIWLSFLTYYSVILAVRMRSRMTGFATDTNGRIFKVMTVNNGQGLYFGGVAAGSLIDQFTGNNNNVGESLGGVVGAATQFYSMNRSAKYMSHPEIIAKMVEEAPNITGAEVFEILKVHSIVNKKHSFIVNCDYKIIRTSKIKYSKNITIDKSYTRYEELINSLNTHK